MYQFSTDEAEVGCKPGSGLLLSFSNHGACRAVTRHPTDVLR